MKKSFITSETGILTLTKIVIHIKQRLFNITPHTDYFLSILYKNTSILVPNKRNDNSANTVITSVTDSTGMRSGTR